MVSRRWSIFVAVAAVVVLVVPASGEPAIVLVKDISPGRDGSSPEWTIDVGGTLFFVADDGIHGSELWRSDGTEAGTAMVRDIRPGRRSSGPEGLVDAEGTLFFSATDGTHGLEIWRSDGTSDGTVMVRDIRPGAGDAIDYQALIGVGDTLYFRAGDGTHGDELWRSDGTAPGTDMVKDIHPGRLGSQPDWIEDVGGTLYFSARDGMHEIRAVEVRRHRRRDRHGERHLAGAWVVSRGVHERWR